MKNGLKQDALSPMLFNFALEYGMGTVQGNQDGVKLMGMHWATGLCKMFIYYAKIYKLQRKVQKLYNTLVKRQIYK